MLTHIDKKYNPTMVDVSEKEKTLRFAKAQSKVKLPSELLRSLKNGELITAKGPVFQTAIIAGTMALKKTSDLIPFCHPIPIDNCKIDISLNNRDEVIILCEVKACYTTGVEMEALTGAAVAALTVYDMCKAASHEIEILETYLLKKSGGKSDYTRQA